LQKELPSGAGRGGGSSDAATALRGLNHLWQTGLNRKELAQLGLQLGADVPVFIHGYTAWAEGVGERLTPVTVPERHYLVVIPACHVSTAAVFSHPGLQRSRARVSLQDYLNGTTCNQCEPLVRRLYPPVNTALDYLSQLGPARMTGTGAAVFCPFATERAARAALEALPPPLTGFIAPGCNRSPLHSILQRLAK
jgi:4-diphosphocytidyl-2-C-methyl-D-erythritol kinase